MGNIAHPADPTPEELETMRYHEFKDKYGPFLDPSRIDDEVLDELLKGTPGHPVPDDEDDGEDELSDYRPFTPDISDFTEEKTLTDETESSQID